MRNFISLILSGFILIFIQSNKTKLSKYQLKDISANKQHVLKMLIIKMANLNNNLNIPLLLVLMVLISHVCGKILLTHMYI